MRISISSREVKETFNSISEKRFGKKVNFQPIEEELGKLKKGGALTYEHLELISNPQYWPFQNFWMWPSKEQIEDKLKDTEDLFKDIDKKFNEEEKRIPGEEDIFRKLHYNIFKHIELASIILRFICPEYYGIYSPPVCRILNPPRGKSYTEEYLNYLKKLREWTDIYGLGKVAFTDMFLWALEENSRFPKKIKDNLSSILYSKVSESNVPLFIENILNASELKRANIYLKLGDYETAAKWAGVAFERVIRDICRKFDIKIKDKMNRYKTLENLTLEVLDRLKINFTEREKIIQVRKRRNVAFHPENKKFIKEEVEEMINVTKTLEEKFLK